MKRLFVLMIAAAMLLTSCSTAKEIDTLGDVVGMAFDDPGEKGGINMSVCIMKANGEFGAEGESASGYFTVSAEADTFMKAKSYLTLKSERTPFFGHNNIMFIAAGADIRYVLESLYSDTDVRGSELVVLCEGNASDVFSSTNFIGEIGSISIHEILELAENSGSIEQISLHDMIKKMNQPSACCIVPVGKTEDETFGFSGMGVVDDYRLRYILDEEETIGALCVIDTLHTYIAEHDGRAAKTVWAESSVRYENGTFLIDVYHEITGDMKTAVYESYLRECIAAAIDISVDTGADFMGFLNTYYKETGRTDMSLEDISCRIEVQAVYSGGGLH